MQRCVLFSISVSCCSVPQYPAVQYLSILLFYTSVFWCSVPQCPAVQYLSILATSTHRLDRVFHRVLQMLQYFGSARTPLKIHFIPIFYRSRSDHRISREVTDCENAGRWTRSTTSFSNRFQDSLRNGNFGVRHCPRATVKLLLTLNVTTFYDWICTQCYVSKTLRGVE